MSPVEVRAAIRALLDHPHCNDEVRRSVAAARRWSEGGRALSPVWVARLARYAEALELASQREARGETPFVDLPRERKARPVGGRPRTLEDRAAVAAVATAPAWALDPALLPKRPPGGRP